MAGSGGKINVRAFAERFEQQGVIKAETKDTKEHHSNKAEGQPKNETKKVNVANFKSPSPAMTGAPPKVIFGRDTLNRQLTKVIGKTPSMSEENEEDKKPKVEPKPVATTKPAVVPRANKVTPPARGPKPTPAAKQVQGAKKALPPEPPATPNGVAEKKDSAKENSAPVDHVKIKPTPAPVLEGIIAKNRLSRVTKRKSYQKPKENPIPPEGILGKAPQKPPRPPIILEVKRDLRAPLPPPPEFAILEEEFEQEEYDEVDIPGQKGGRPVSIIQPMTEDEELGEFGETYDDVDAVSSPTLSTPARKNDPLPAPPPLSPTLQATVAPVGPALIEEEVYDDVSDGENQDEGEMEDIYETFDDVASESLSSAEMPAAVTDIAVPALKHTDAISLNSVDSVNSSASSQSLTRSGSQETLSSTASKDKEDKELEKQRKKEEKERKKHEEKEKKEREKKEKEEKRLKALKEKEEMRLKKEEEKRIRKVFNIKGDETPQMQGSAIRTYGATDTANHLPYIKGQVLYVIRMEGNPEGKWLAKSEEGKYGYVDSGDIASMDETYDDAESFPTPDDGIMEETYECVDIHM